VSSTEIRIVSGGRVDDDAARAIVEAIGRVVTERAAPPVMPRSAWALAGRLEASGRATIGSRSQLLGDRTVC